MEKKRDAFPSANPPTTALFSIGSEPSIAEPAHNVCENTPNRFAKTENVFCVEASTKEEALEKARMYVHTESEGGVLPPGKAPIEIHKILRSYKLDEKLVKVLDQYAARETLDKSDVVADALKQFLDLKDEEKQKADRIQKLRQELAAERAERDATPCPLCGKFIDFYEDEPFEWDEEKQGEWPGTLTYSEKRKTYVHIECLHKIGESEYEQ